VIPHSRLTNKAAIFVTSYPVVCTSGFAVAFFVAWSKNDEQRLARRSWLLKTAVGFALSVLVTVVVRPWIRWPAPNQNPEFLSLFPKVFRGTGTLNCFPSHSTLAYFTVAIGFWEFRRGLSIFLSLWTILSVSLPRMYVGGHYPIDVLASLLLALGVMGILWKRPIPSRAAGWLIHGSGTVSLIRNMLLTVWLIELGEGFRATEFLVTRVARLTF
jgi:undecaprenyl-diphosphatase